VHTTAQIAAHLQCRTEHVIALIRDGALRATSISRPGGGRPTWRITQEALEEFLAGGKSPPAKPTRRQRQQPQPTEYF